MCSSSLFSSLSHFKNWVTVTQGRNTGPFYCRYTASQSWLRNWKQTHCQLTSCSVSSNTSFQLCRKPTFLAKNLEESEWVHKATTTHNSLHHNNISHQPLTNLQQSYIITANYIARSKINSFKTTKHRLVCNTSTRHYRDKNNDCSTFYSLCS